MPSVSQELRPQDSIPFLRRVSADLQKSEAVRFLAQIEMPDSPEAEESVSGSPPGRRISFSRPMDQDISPRDHSFVKTTFSKRASLVDPFVICDLTAIVLQLWCVESAS